MWGLQRMLASPRLTSEFMGMASYAPASFHDLMDDKVESDGSSIGDVVAPSHPLSRECAMADALGQPPVVHPSGPQCEGPGACVGARRGVTTKAAELAATL